MGQRRSTRIDATYTIGGLIAPAASRTSRACWRGCCVRVSVARRLLLAIEQRRVAARPSSPACEWRKRFIAESSTMDVGTMALLPDGNVVSMTTSLSMSTVFVWNPYTICIPASLTLDAPLRRMTLVNGVIVAGDELGRLHRFKVEAIPSARACCVCEEVGSRSSSSRRIRSSLTTSCDDIEIAQKTPDSSGFPDRVQRTRAPQPEKRDRLAVCGGHTWLGSTTS